MDFPGMLEGYTVISDFCNKYFGSTTYNSK